MGMQMSIAIGLGIVLLICVLYIDFSKRIIKPLHAFKYYFAYVVFCVINVFLYLGLCSFMLDFDLNIVQISGISGTNFDIKFISPLIIAIMYHATGLFKFKFGNLEFDIYQRLLSTFEGIFALEYTEISVLQKAIDDAQTELDDIKSIISQLHQIGSQKGWDGLGDRWAEIESDLAVLHSQATYLEDVLCKLQTRSQIDEVIADIKSRIRYLQNTQIEKLKRYLFEYTMKYMKSEADIMCLIRKIGGKIDAHPHPVNFVTREMVFCGMFGLLFGPIFAYLQHYDKLRYSWYGLISMGMFGFIFSTVRNAGKNIQDALLRAVLAGGAAGFAGHAVWMLLHYLNKPQNMDFTQLIFGLEFGVVLGLVIYLFRNWMPWGTMVRAPLMIVIGGLAFATIGILNNLNQSPLLALLGVVATIGVALGLDVVKAPVADVKKIDSSVRQ